jgi:antitoxin component YwqK of YwqJK toxin-antitoxin module
MDWATKYVEIQQEFAKHHIRHNILYDLTHLINLKIQKVQILDKIKQIILSNQLELVDGLYTCNHYNNILFKCIIKDRKLSKFIASSRLYADDLNADDLNADDLNADDLNADDLNADDLNAGDMIVFTLDDNEKPSDDVLVYRYHGMLRIRYEYMNGMVSKTTSYYENGVIHHSTKHDSNNTLKCKYMCYYPNGKKHFKVKMLDNKNYGTCLQWHENGTLKSTCNYIDGAQDGSSIKYDDAGNVHCRIVYMNGKVKDKYHTFTYHDNGAVHQEHSYDKHNNLTFETNYLESGIMSNTILYEHNVPTFETNYFESGIISNTMLYEHGVPKFKSVCHPSGEDYSKTLLDYGKTRSYNVVNKIDPYLSLKLRKTVTEEICFKMVGRDWRELDHVIESMQTIPLCMIALKQNVTALIFIKNKELKKETYMSAILFDWKALQYILLIDQTAELCIQAINQDILALEYVKSDDPSIYIHAIKKDWRTILTLPDIHKTVIFTWMVLEKCEDTIKNNPVMLSHLKQNDVICMKALTINPLSLTHVVNQTMRICERAIELDGMMLRCVEPKFHTVNLCTTAVTQNGCAIQYVDKKIKYYDDICKRAVQNKWIAMAFIDDTIQTTEMAWSVIIQNGNSLEFIRDDLQTVELCLVAVAKNMDVLKYVKKLTYDICLVAVKRDGSNLKYVPDVHKTKKMCLTAINSNEYARNYLPILTHGMGISDLFRLMDIYHAVNDTICCTMRDIIRDTMCGTMRDTLYEKCADEIQTDATCLKYAYDSDYIIPSELYEMALSIDGMILQYVPEQSQTQELCLIAVENNTDAVKFVKIIFDIATSMTLYDQTLLDGILDPDQLVDYLDLGQVSVDACAYIKEFQHMNDCLKLNEVDGHLNDLFA